MLALRFSAAWCRGCSSHSQRRFLSLHKARTGKPTVGAGRAAFPFCRVSGAGRAASPFCRVSDAFSLDPHRSTVCRPSWRVLKPQERSMISCGACLLCLCGCSEGLVVFACHRLPLPFAGSCATLIMDGWGGVLLRGYFCTGEMRQFKPD